jgi:hypothetical protein
MPPWLISDASPDCSNEKSLSHINFNIQIITFLEAISKIEKLF